MVLRSRGSGSTEAAGGGVAEGFATSCGKSDGFQESWQDEGIRKDDELGDRSVTELQDSQSVLQKLSQEHQRW